jgi:hypothetical protein
VAPAPSLGYSGAAGYEEPAAAAARSSQRDRGALRGKTLGSHSSRSTSFGDKYWVRGDRNFLLTNLGGLEVGMENRCTSHVFNFSYRK